MSLAAALCLSGEVVPAGGAAPVIQPVLHGPGGRSAGPADARVVLFRSGRAAAEPTIAISRKGDVYVPAADLGGENGAAVLRLTRDGRWVDVSPRLGPAAAHPVTLDPYVHRDANTSRLFTVDLTVGCSLLSFSDDGGGSWTTNPLACGRPVNDHQTLFSGPPAISIPLGYPNVLYYCFNDVATSSCSKSLDGGITFSATGEPAFSPAHWTEESCSALHGHGVVDAQGSVYLPKSHCGEPWIAISHDEGLTWQRSRVAARRTSAADASPSVAIDASGSVYYAWVAANRLPYVAISRDGGLSWSKPFMVAAPGIQEANLVSIAAGSKGRIALAYVGSEDSPYQTCAPRPDCDRPYSGVTWHGYITTSRTMLEESPLFESAAVNPRRDPLVVGRCGPGRCYPLWDFIDVEIDDEGQPWAAYVDGDGAAPVNGEAIVATIRDGWRLR